MLFIPQKKSGECGLCIIKFILKNYQNKRFTDKITTNFIPLSTINILLSNKLVVNKLKLVENKYIFKPIIFPEIIHCKSLWYNHYILLIEKKDDFYKIYDPCSCGFKYYTLKKLRNVMSGYLIELYDLKDKMLPNKFYIPYPIRVFAKFLCFDFIVILVLFFLFYWKNKKILIKYIRKVGGFYVN